MSEISIAKEQEALAALYADREPSAPEIQDEEIEQILADASDGVGETLRSVMGPPLLGLFGRVESLLANQDPEFVDSVNELACFHPVYRLPYTQHLPGTSRVTEADMVDPADYVRRNFPGMVTHNTEVSGWNSQMVVASPSDLSFLIESSVASGGSILDDDLWALWNGTHEVQDRHGYCTLGGLALNLSRRNLSNPFLDVEKHVIETLLTHRNTTFLSVGAGRSSIRFNRQVLMPEPTDNRDHEHRKRWLRAAGVLVAIIQQDVVLEKDVADALEDGEARGMVEKRTMRGQDKPSDLVRSVIDGYEEAICGVLPGVNAELLRYSPETADPESRLCWDKNLAEVISYHLSSGLTRRSPLGYGGPLTIQGVGLTEQPTVRLSNRSGRRYPGMYRRRIAPEASGVLEAMCKYWRREFHYVNTLASKSDGTQPIRAGGKCPFSEAYKAMPVPLNLIEAMQQMIFLLSRAIDPKIPEPVYDYSSGRPYRPSLAPDISSVVSEARPAPYQKLGLQAARQLLAP